MAANRKGNNDSSTCTIDSNRMSTAILNVFKVAIVICVALDMLGFGFGLPIVRNIGPHLFLGIVLLGQ